MVGRLEGKIALVTGGASGIGLATVETFVREGAKVVIADVQDDKGPTLEKRLGSSAVYRRCDVMLESDIKAAIDTAKSAFGGLDILFNNAGIRGTAAGVADMDADDWDLINALLVRGPMLGMKHAIPLMEARGGGSIISTGSIAAFEAGWGAAYSAGKAALINLTKNAALELAPKKIRVNAVCPGVIVTPILGVVMGFDRPASDRMAEEMVGPAASWQPIPRAGLPQDLANAALFFASDESSFVTGTAMLVDGGISLAQREVWDAQTPSPLRESLARGAANVQSAS